MISVQERVAMMSDAQRIQFARNLNPEEYAQIPSYWGEHLKDRIERIQTRQNDRHTTASFGMIADFHFTVNNLHSPALMKRMLDECSIPFFFLAGDFVSGMGMIAPDDLIQEIEAVRSLFAPIAEYALVVTGNHDPAFSTIPGHGYAENLTGEQLYDHVTRPQTRYPNRVFREAGNDFYADDFTGKIRYIALDTHDTPRDEVGEDGFPVYPKFKWTGFRQEQLQWFAHKALRVPTPEWTVVLCTHESMQYDPDYQNWDMMYGIIDAFRRHTRFDGHSSAEDPAYQAEICVDYSGEGGDFAAWVGGHTHVDDSSYVNGILCLSTMSDSFNDIGNTDEQAFDIFTIDKRTHTLHATRIGRGGDREFSYEVF